ncbi:MAG: hypothetical protein ACRD9S_24020 [Pyrinomonadaceae bacterium]
MSTTQPDQAKLDLQYRTQLILWVGFLSMFFVYYFLPAVIPWQRQPENQTLRIIFNVMSPLLVATSFFVKWRFLSRSVAAQDVRLVNTGFIVAAAFCEAGALLGLLDFLTAHDRYYFILIGFALFGLVLHFPRRIHLEAASYKSLAAG